MQLHMKPINGINDGGRTVFLTNDPQYALSIPAEKEPAELEIVFYCRELNKEEIIQRFEKLLADDTRKREEAENRDAYFETLYNAAINSASWKLTRPLRVLSAVVNGRK